MCDVNLAKNYANHQLLVPLDPEAAIGIRMLDRVFDNYVMNVMQIVVNEYIRDPQNPDEARCREARAHPARRWEICVKVRVRSCRRLRQVDGLRYHRSRSQS